MLSITESGLIYTHSASAGKQPHTCESDSLFPVWLLQHPELEQMVSGPVPNFSLSGPNVYKKKKGIFCTTCVEDSATSAAV